MVLYFNLYCILSIYFKSFAMGRVVDLINPVHMFFSYIFLCFIRKYPTGELKMSLNIDVSDCVEPNKKTRKIQCFLCPEKSERVVLKNLGRGVAIHGGPPASPCCADKPGVPHSSACEFFNFLRNENSGISNFKK